jgi:hypothetical protein
VPLLHLRVLHLGMLSLACLLILIVGLLLLSATGRLGMLFIAALAIAGIHLLDDTLHPLLIRSLTIGNVICLNLVQRRRLRHLVWVMEFVNSENRISSHVFIQSTAANSKVSTTGVLSLGHSVAFVLNSWHLDPI